MVLLFILFFVFADKKSVENN